MSTVASTILWPWVNWTKQTWDDEAKKRQKWQNKKQTYFDAILAENVPACHCEHVPVAWKAFTAANAVHMTEFDQESLLVVAIVGHLDGGLLVKLSRDQYFKVSKLTENVRSKRFVCEVV